MPDRTMEDQAAEQLPLVVIGCSGGLVQWDISAPGCGSPVLYVLDFDLSESPSQENRDHLIRETEAAVLALEARGDAVSDPSEVANLRDSLSEFKSEPATESGLLPRRGEGQ